MTTQDTEVLTYSGWKPITHLTTIDKIATLKKESIEFHHPTKIFYKLKEANILTIDTPTISVSLDLSKELFVRTDQMRLVTFESFTDYKFKKNGKYHNKPNPLQMKYKSIILDKDNWLLFYATYILNGTIENDVLTLRFPSDKSPETYDFNHATYYYNNGMKLIQELLNTIPDTEVKVQDYDLLIKNNNLINYLQNQDPILFLHKLSYRDLDLLWLFISNSCYQCFKYANYTFKAKSQQQADFIQILMLFVNQACIINEDLTMKQVFALHLIKKENMKVNKIKDFIYFIKVPNDLIYIRLNGKCCWINSM